jgi:hypothetical protein
MAGISIVGRPSDYTPAIAREICSRLAEGQSLTAICRDDHMPTFQTIYEWVNGGGTAAREDKFPEMYARARAMKIEYMAEQLEEIADDARNDWMDKVVGWEGDTIRVLDHEHVTRSKLRLDTRKFLLSKLRPEIYGDRLAHQMLDEKGKPAKLEITVTRVEPAKP